LNQQTISISIISYNRPNDLLALLKSLSLQNDLDKCLCETLILNNASTVSYSAIEKYADENPFLKINFINSKENLGVARGRNRLMEIAKGDLLFEIDDDIEFVHPDSMIKLSSVFDKQLFSEANTAMITTRVLYYDTKDVQMTAFPHKSPEKYLEKNQFLTSYFIGCSHILKRSILKETGFYPDDFHYGMEEYDLGYRILNAGYTIGYDNEVTVEHKESPLGRQANYKKLQMQWINKSKVAWRYLPFIYFLTTSLAWGIEYIRKAKGNWGTFFISILEVLKIPFQEKRNVISKNALKYMKSVEARPWY